MTRLEKRINEFQQAAESLEEQLWMLEMRQGVNSPERHEIVLALSRVNSLLEKFTCNAQSKIPVATIP